MYPKKILKKLSKVLSMPQSRIYYHAIAKLELQVRCRGMCRPFAAEIYLSLQSRSQISFRYALRDNFIPPLFVLRTRKLKR